MDSSKLHPPCKLRVYFVVFDVALARMDCRCGATKWCVKRGDWNLGAAFGRFMARHSHGLWLYRLLDETGRVLAEQFQAKAPHTTIAWYPNPTRRPEGEVQLFLRARDDDGEGGGIATYMRSTGTVVWCLQCRIRVGDAPDYIAADELAEAHRSAAGHAVPDERAMFVTTSVEQGVVDFAQIADYPETGRILTVEWARRRQAADRIADRP